jgi:hypothetical protein
VLSWTRLARRTPDAVGHPGVNHEVSIGDLQVR